MYEQAGSDFTSLPAKGRGPVADNKGGLKGSMHHPLKSAQDIDYSRIKIWRA